MEICKIFELAEQANVKVAKFSMPRSGPMFFVKDSRNRLFNDGYSMDRDEVVEWLKNRCRKAKDPTTAMVESLRGDKFYKAILP